MQAHRVGHSPARDAHNTRKTSLIRTDSRFNQMGEHGPTLAAKDDGSYMGDAPITWIAPRRRALRGWALPEHAG